MKPRDEAEKHDGAAQAGEGQRRRCDAATGAVKMFKVPSSNGLAANSPAHRKAMLERGRGSGLIRSMSGREIPFQFPFVQVVGAPLGGKMPGIQLLREGARVGFDVGWTSRMRWDPVVAAPPACSTIIAIGAASYNSLSFPFGPGYRKIPPLIRFR